MAPDSIVRWCFEAGSGGSFEDFSLVASVSAVEPLGVGEVRVEVRAAGLNFRDVLISLGMCPGGGVCWWRGRWGRVGGRPGCGGVGCWRSCDGFVGALGLVRWL